MPCPKANPSFQTWGRLSDEAVMPDRTPKNKGTFKQELVDALRRVGFKLILPWTVAILFCLVYIRCTADAPYQSQEATTEKRQ